LPGKNTSPKKKKKTSKTNLKPPTYINPELQNCNQEESSGGSTENSEGGRRRGRRRGLLGG
jgi:hypothetical protein